MTDAQRQAILDEAVATAAGVTNPQRQAELEIHFFPEILSATGVSGDTLRELVQAKRATVNSPRFVDSVNCAGQWQRPVPLTRPVLPAPPIATLPPWAGEFVKAEAEATQTPADLPFMMMLAAFGTACAKKARVEIRSGWSEPLNIWTVTQQRPGTRKSVVVADVTKPIIRFDREAAAEAAPEVETAKSRYRVVESRLKHIEGRAAKAKACDEREELQREAEDLAGELRTMRVPAAPRLLADDTTPEGLATLLRDQGGRMAILSPEGGIFDLMAGRYSKNGSPNLDVFLKGHVGDDLRVDRVGRPPEHIPEPALTLGLTVQPEVIRGLWDRPTFRGRGLLGRFLYAMAEDLLGYRKPDATPVPVAVRDAYHAGLRGLLELDPGRDGDGGYRTRTLYLSPDGQVLIREFVAWLEPQLAEFGELGHMTDWAGKLAGAVGRIAGLLHLAERSGQLRLTAHTVATEPWDDRIDVDTMHRAITIGHYLIPHARAAYAEMGASPVTEDARHLLGWILSHNKAEISRRDLFAGVRPRFRQVEDIDPGVARLVGHGYLRAKQPAKHTGPGRPASPVYEVNPYAQNAHNTQNPDSDIGSVESVN